jgi:glycosyltransferase involved in cell wall biosynthesis
MSVLSKLDPRAVHVAVIVSTYTVDRLETLRKCLNGILDNTRRPDEIVVVVDRNLSLFQLLERELQDSVVSVMLSDGSGVCAARNTGARVCESEILIFIDDDVFPDREWLVNMTTMLSRDSVAGAGGNILPDYEKGARELPSEILWLVGCTYRGHPEGDVPITRPIGSTMAFRRDVFVAVGGFDSRFGPSSARRTSSNEELVLSENIRTRFGPDVIRYQPESIVYHRVPKSRTTLRFMIQRSWVEGTSKAEVRSSYLGDVLNHDQQYLFGTMLPSMARYLSSGSWSGIKTALQLMIVTCVTAAGFLTHRISSMLRGKRHPG